MCVCVLYAFQQREMADEADENEKEKERMHTDETEQKKRNQQERSSKEKERERKAPYTFAIQCDPKQFGVCTDTGTQSSTAQSGKKIDRDRVKRKNSVFLPHEQLQ